MHLGARHRGDSFVTLGRLWHLTPARVLLDPQGKEQKRTVTEARRGGKWWNDLFDTQVRTAVRTGGPALSRVR